MKNDIILALLFVGGPALAFALWASGSALYERGKKAGGQAVRAMPIHPVFVERADVAPVRVERRLNYEVLRAIEEDPRLKEHVIARMMEDLTKEVWKYAVVTGDFDARSMEQRLIATVYLGKKR